MKHLVERNCDHMKTKFFWYVTCNCCGNKTWRYITADFLSGTYKGQSAIICRKCSEKYRLFRRGAQAEVEIN